MVNCANLELGPTNGGIKAHLQQLRKIRSRLSFASMGQLRPNFMLENVFGFSG